MKIAGIDKQTQRKPGLPRHSERGAATIIALLVMGLLTIFVALALSRTTAESLIMGNDAAEARSFYAAQASIETMSRNFNKIYDVRLSPTTADINNVQTTIPQGFTGYTFNQVLTRTGTDEVTTLAGGPFEGLTALRDPWNLDTTATGPSGVQVDLRRTFYSNRIPIFQFGIFYNDDMELSPGAAFAFGGRVHTNGNFYIRGGGTVQFNSRVSAAGEIVVDVARNGRANIASPSASEMGAGFGQNIYIKDSQGAFQQLKMGEASVLGGPDVTSSNSDVPDGSYNPLWSCKSLSPRYACRPTDDIFDGNLIADVKKLELPLKLGGNTDNIEIIKRGESTDNQILSLSRYYNKPGIRISLADSQSRLPGGTGGIRLDAKYNLLGQLDNVSGKFGYQSKPMTGAGVTYRTTRLNAYRLYTGSSYTDGGMPGSRQTWIKVEIVNVDATTLAITATDITEDFLSLGFTEAAPSAADPLVRMNDAIKYPAGTDARAIIKLQRWFIPGPPAIRSAYPSSYPNSTGITQQSGKDVFTYVGTAPNGYSVIEDNDYVASSPSPGEDTVNKIAAKIYNSSTSAFVNDNIMPFPIEMFDAREGIALESAVQWSDLSVNDVSPNGVMSMIDIDVANLRSFLKGDYDGQFPNGLRSTDVPRDRGWMMYVSDRRGDRDNDGEFDMEDVYGPNDNIFQLPEDVNGNGALDVDTQWWEGVSFNATPIKADIAAFFDHKYYRRGVRLINGSQLPGDMNNGFTLASENGVYIFGNYNATGVATYGTPTPASDYRPVAVAAAGAPWIVSSSQVPSSVVADAVTILSQKWDGTAGWSDGASFGAPVYCRPVAANGSLPIDYPGRPARETTVRTAILQGDTISSILDTPNQGGLFSERLNGSVNNFKRFLEEWRATAVPNVNYAGSLINLFNSRNNNGTFKYGSARVYNAPNRNWVFDDSFLDATRLPPATPFFQYLQVTGFQRINN
jgi:hypothetical protein